MLCEEYSVGLSKMNTTGTDTLRIKRLREAIEGAIVEIHNGVSIQSELVMAVGRKPLV